MDKAETKTLSRDRRSSQIFKDHLEIARQRFIEKNKREPNQDELLQEYRELIYFFYE